tara:strand:- start:8328 stop:8654 length:327 start_codon:yes stop_codon:yes gene_type:complete
MHYIFEVHLHPGYSAEEYAESWQRASRIIQRAPGARGTRLHRKIGDERVLLAIATWDSKQQRDAMEGDLPDEVERIIRSQAPFIDFKLIGEFEAPEWVVIPPHLEDDD